MKVTIKMIAERAGVSIGTVDRAFNNRGRISDKTKEQILTIAREMGYQPNKIARALKKKRKMKIAVVLPCRPHYFIDELMQGVKDAQETLKDYDVYFDFIRTNTLSPNEQKTVLSQLDASIYDAVVINAGGNELAGEINRIVDSGVPVVTFNSDAQASKRCLYVGEDATHFGRVAGELMSKMVREDGTIAVFAGFSIIDSHRERATGFKRYMAEYRPNVKIIDVSDYHDNEEEARQTMQRILEHSVCPDGIFCVSAPGVVGVGQCLKEHNLSRKVRLIGYDINNPSAELLLGGYCDILMYQEPRNQSYQALMQAFRMLTEDWQPSHDTYITRTQIVMAENLYDFFTPTK